MLRDLRFNIWEWLYWSTYERYGHRHKITRFLRKRYGQVYLDWVRRLP